MYSKSYAFISRYGREMKSRYSISRPYSKSSREMGDPCSRRGRSAYYRVRSGIQSQLSDFTTILTTKDAHGGGPGTYLQSQEARAGLQVRARKAGLGTTGTAKTAALVQMQRENSSARTSAGREESKSREYSSISTHKYMISVSSTS